MERAIPRSALSISHALDKLDAELEAEEEGEEEDITFTTHSERPSQGWGSIHVEDSLSSSPQQRCHAAKTMTSHPLDFVDQYPSIAVVTTASLPWLTGTAVNPTLRAAYLCHRGHAVTLLVPWVPPDVQPRLFPDGVLFQTQKEQADAVEAGIRQRVPFTLPAISLVDAGDSNTSPLALASVPPTDAEEGVHPSQQYPMELEDPRDVHGDGYLTSPSTSRAPPPPFRLVFYPGKYDPALGSIIPETDLQTLVPRPVDCIILEEPEHLTWYHTGKRWTRAFPRPVPIIGVMHTNYVDYARRVAGDAAAGTLKRLNKFLCRQHTHKVIKLSDAVQTLPRQETCFVHGVSDKFLAVGRRHNNEIGIYDEGSKDVGGGGEKGTAESGALQEIEEEEATGISSTRGWVGRRNRAQQQQQEEKAATSTPAPRFIAGAYFLGKALWAKGFQELLDRFEEHKTRCEAAGITELPPVDVYGKGEQLEDIRIEAARRGLNMTFLGAKDHLSPDIAEYRLFVNPSTSDVVATTSAEALAMGKWLLVPLHPCNDFLSTFRNCIMYSNAEEFSAGLERALSCDPVPLSEEEARRLSWDAATDRLLHCCASVEVGKGAPLVRVAEKTGWVGYNVGHGVYSVVSGAIDSVRRAMQTPIVAAARPAGPTSGAPPSGGGADVVSHALHLSPSLT